MLPGSNTPKSAYGPCVLSQGTPAQSTDTSTTEPIANSKSERVQSRMTGCLAGGEGGGEVEAGGENGLANQYTTQLKWTVIALVIRREWAY